MAMLTVNELAIQSNAPAHVVRYYARIGLIKPSGQQDNGYRLFRPRDANRLRFIRMATLLGFTLSEIKQITEHADHGESPCEDVRRIIQHHIRALKKWEGMPDGVPDGHSVCHLIESFDIDDDDDV
jgi:DNA-binding transcriptional MerR regulator